MSLFNHVFKEHSDNTYYVSKIGVQTTRVMCFCTLHRKATLVCGRLVLVEKKVDTIAYKYSRLLHHSPVPYLHHKSIYFAETHAPHTHQHENILDHNLVALFGVIASAQTQAEDQAEFQALTGGDDVCTMYRFILLHI